MATIAHDVRTAAAAIARTATEAGYQFDFSANSLADVDRFLNENADGGEPRPGGLLSKDLGSRVFALGSYVGEVIRRAVGGEWVTDDELDAELTVTLRLADGTRLWPNQQVMKHIMTGAAASIVDYAEQCGVETGVIAH